MPGHDTGTRLAGHESLVVTLALAAVVLSSGAFILSGGGTGMSALRMSIETGPAGSALARVPDIVTPIVWTPAYALTIFAMWWLMMVAMMVPSAGPVVLLYGALFPGRGLSGATGFLLGYLSIWGVFSAIATAVQGVLVARALVSPMYMTVVSPLLAGVILIGAGVWQMTRTKAACLERCRSPADTLVRVRRTGRAATFRMGLRHGTDCLGCCWALMALLFAGGIMNLWWILALAAYVAIEKLTPWGARIARPFGVALVASGLAVCAVSIIGVA